MTEKISITNSKGLKLAAVLHAPESISKYPAVLLLHGFTGYKDETHIQVLAEQLCSLGLAALRFDCSGFGESEGTIEDDFRVSNYLADIAIVYEYLKNIPTVDVNNIGLWGHSMGGMLAVIFAATHPEIKALCLISPPTRLDRKDRQDRTSEWQRTGYFEKQSSRRGFLRIPYDFLLDSQKWDAMDYASKITMQSLIVIGTGDTNVLPENTREIYNAIVAPKQWLEVAGMWHSYKKNPQHVEKVHAAVVEFLLYSLK